jgi:hypothetical protein
LRLNNLSKATYAKASGWVPVIYYLELLYFTSDPPRLCTDAMLILNVSLLYYACYLI